MGRIDPVEGIGVSQQRNGNVLNVKPPAMRVRDDLICPQKVRQKFMVMQLIRIGAGIVQDLVLLVLP